MTTIYGLKTCDTCRKAIKALPGATLRDIRAQPLTAAEIAGFLDAFGEALVNRASTTWRGLDEAARAQTPQALRAAHPALMKRPVIAAGGALHLGWTPATRAALGVD
jgi:arsenate reductase (glutaredoxin)